MKRTAVGIVGIISIMLALLIVPVTLALSSSLIPDDGPRGPRTSLICEEGGAGSAQIPDKYRKDIAEAAKVSGLSQEVLAAQIRTESNWQEDATSPSDARGLGQIKDIAWKDVGATGDPYNGHDNIKAMAKVHAKHRSMLEGRVRGLKGDEREQQLAKLMLSAYRLGANVVEEHDGVPDRPEIRDYLRKILGPGVQAVTTDCSTKEEPITEDIPDGEWTHPLPGGRFTSPFGYRGCIPDVPCTEDVRNHNGLDFSTPGSDVTTVVAPTNLKITKVNRHGAQIVIARQEGDPGLVFSFVHCAAGSHRVKVGDKLSPGDPICTEGDTGEFSQTAHLHFQINEPSAPDDRYSRGTKTAIDPEPILIQQGVTLE